MYRKTYMEVYLDNIKYNVEKIINKYSDYEYYFGVVKASCYGLGLEPIKKIIELPKSFDATKNNRSRL